jgi:hypothetical protein
MYSKLARQANKRKEDRMGNFNPVEILYPLHLRFFFGYPELEAAVSTEFNKKLGNFPSNFTQKDFLSWGFNKGYITQWIKHDDPSRKLFLVQGLDDAKTSK